jgi:hypothetical protein
MTRGLDVFDIQFAPEFIGGKSAGDAQLISDVEPSHSSLLP